ncbi:MAG: molybdenum cofactor biosynthesis protein MoaE, partial [Chloroflexi bacterium]|nr:molybdenum cofactor biosynthesis protein MoaE [Chloroflexota bacterium]
MRVNVKFFAIFREFTGIKTEWKEIADGTSIEKLWNDYRAAHARLGNLRAAYAINQKLARAETVLREGDEIGFLPPVSGGEKLNRQDAKGTKKKNSSNVMLSEAKHLARNSKKFKTSRDSSLPSVAQNDNRSRESRMKNAFITHQPLNLAALIKQVEFPGAGAIITFSGVVRDHAHGKTVDHLEYEAYPEMAEATMREIIAEIKLR